MIACYSPNRQQQIFQQYDLSSLLNNHFAVTCETSTWSWIVALSSSIIPSILLSAFLPPIGPMPAPPPCQIYDRPCEKETTSEAYYHQLGHTTIVNTVELLQVAQKQLRSDH